MGKSTSKASIKKRSSALPRKQVALMPTASQRQLLHILATGIEGEEPNLLAGRR